MYFGSIGSQHDTFPALILSQRASPENFNFLIDRTSHIASIQIGLEKKNKKKTEKQWEEEKQWEKGGKTMRKKAEQTDK